MDTDAATSKLVGRTLLGRYVVHEKTDDNDSTLRFTAADVRLGSPVVVEVLRSNASSAAQKAFENRAKVPCRIAHLNIPMPRELGTLDDGTRFVVWKQLRAESLAERALLGGALPFSDVIRIGTDMLSALVAAHERGVTHGTLGPTSVLLVSREDTIEQLAIAGFGDGASPVSLGRLDLACSAPELIDGAATTASDLYACAAILYFAATGFPPFTAPTRSQLVEAVRGGRLRSPRSLRAQLPSWFVRFVLHGMQVNPRRRFPSAKAMLEILTRLGTHTRTREGRSEMGTEIVAHGGRARVELTAAAAPTTLRMGYTDRGLDETHQSALVPA